jgi:hypothetical protein
VRIEFLNTSGDILDPPYDAFPRRAFSGAEAVNWPWLLPFSEYERFLATRHKISSGLIA